MHQKFTVLRSSILLLALLIAGCGESETERREREFKKVATNIFALLAVGIAISAWWWNETDKKRKEEKHRQQQEQERKKAVVEHAAKWLDYFLTNIFVECLVIDSNIWMNQRHEVFFESLPYVARISKSQTSMPGVQFDEMCNIKKRTKYEDDKSKSARLGIQRIEKAQREGWLKIESLSMDAPDRAYADPEIVKFIKNSCKLGRRVCFISDDVELRVRVRGHLSDVPSTAWTIIELQTVLPGCEALVKAGKLS